MSDFTAKMHQKTLETSHKPPRHVAVANTRNAYASRLKKTPAIMYNCSGTTMGVFCLLPKSFKLFRDCVCFHWFVYICDIRTSG